MEPAGRDRPRPCGDAPLAATGLCPSTVPPAVGSLAEAADLLARRAASPRHPVEFRPLAAALEPPRCIAVDGSAAVLADSGSAWVVAFRAAAVAWPGPPPAEPQPEVVATVPSEAQALVDARCARLGLPEPAVRTADALADALRALAELEAALAAVAEAPPGSLLLVDGALLGLPPAPAAIAARLAEACRARGVRLAAVAKRSGLERGSLPLIPSLLAQAAAEGLQGPWWVEAEPGLHVAKLHAAARHAFRVDGDAGVLPDLAAMARDAVYTGYPYPLALAHNAVALTGAHVRELRGRLELELRSRGTGAVELARDFHAVLDANVPG